MQPIPQKNKVQMAQIGIENIQKLTNIFLFFYAIRITAFLVFFLSFQHIFYKKAFAQNFIKTLANKPDKQKVNPLKDILSIDTTKNSFSTQENKENLLPNKKRQKKERNLVFIFKLDNRFSFARDQMISIYGFRTGFRLFKKHEIGIGLNWLGSRNTYNGVPLTTQNPNEPIQKGEGAFFYKYFGFFYEPILYKKDKWGINLPLQFGGGKAGLNIIQPETGQFLEKREARYVMFEPALSAEYKLTKFVGVGAGAGYRFAFSDQKIIYENLTKPVYIIKLKIYLENIYNAVFRKE